MIDEISIKLPDSFTCSEAAKAMEIRVRRISVI